MGSENWEAAITCFFDSIKINASHVQSYGNLGVCYSYIGKKQLALDALDKAIELDPNYEPAIQNRKVFALQEEGKPSDKGLDVVDYYKKVHSKKTQTKKKGGVPFALQDYIA